MSHKCATSGKTNILKAHFFINNHIETWETTKQFIK